MQLKPLPRSRGTPSPHRPASSSGVNTAADGSGTAYSANTTVAMPANVDAVCHLEISRTLHILPASTRKQDLHDGDVGLLSNRHRSLQSQIPHRTVTGLSAVLTSEPTLRSARLYLPVASAQAAWLR